MAMAALANRSSLLLLLFLLLHSLSASQPLDEQNPERNSLLSLKSALGNPTSLSSWNSTTSHCRFVGVQCRNSGAVTSLSLSLSSLVGPIPPPLFALTRLALLDLSSNFLTGALPADLFLRLSSLSSLDLSNNSLSGRIPAEIGNLKSLTDLYLGINQLSGPLPREIGNLTALKNFFSPNCFIQGPLPEELSRLTSLTKLDLSDNPLSSPLPSSIGKLGSLSILNLVSTQLNGSLPYELGNCTSLKTLMVSFNSLSGSLPESLAALRMLSFSAEGNELSGSLPSWLGTWDLIDSLLLANNRFSGRIPPDIGNCSSLTHVSLSNNLLAGPIPSQVCRAPLLTEVDLDRNFLSGSIGSTFVDCLNLTQLTLVDNRIVGTIPDYLSELPLMVLELDSNNFTGSIPESLWNLSGLMEFSASSNLLEGILSSRIGNAEQLERLVLNGNRIRGEIPKEIGNLSSMSVLSLNSNFFTGSIPKELGNCTQLSTLDLGSNRLNGSIPEALTGLAQLQCLVVSHNQLTGLIPSKPSAYFGQAAIPDSSFIQHHGVYDLSYNRLTGPIPEVLGSCIVVVDLLLAHNRLTGTIPRSLSQLRNLTTLDLSDNMLSHEIPEELGECRKLQGLSLAGNRLNGAIPESLCKINSLVKLNLSRNKLSGPIPSNLRGMNELTHLDLSFNELAKELPVSLTGLVNLVGLYVQENKLSGGLSELFASSSQWKVQALNLSKNLFNGELPRSLGNLSYLAYMDLHGNAFTGKIPAELGNLTQLVYFDVSDNGLTGEIPERICGLADMVYFNVSNNRLEGPVPGTRTCRNFTKASLSGNEGLCGKILGSDCAIYYYLSERQPPILNSWGLLCIVLGCLIVVLAAVYVSVKWRGTQACKNLDSDASDESKLSSSIGPSDLCFLNTSSRTKEPLSINVAMFEQPLLRLTLADILRATDNFSKANIIGDGGFGTVYRATLPDGRIVAVKKLNHAKAQGHREFLAEMETLGKVKHWNLIQLLGYCSYGEEKLLVYDYMVNGSLDLWLRNRTGTLGVLDWPKRVNIAIGAARGIAFLHHGFIPHIIHRDIKASNILLDGEFEPKVADFGLARLISACETHVSTDIAGTFGYIAPEYGQSWRSTTRGDVYSFGVILLELVTGKEPTGSEFKEVEGGNMMGWVLGKVRKGEGADVIDPRIGSSESTVEMLRVVQIAAMCLAENPADRPTMLNVVKFLKVVAGE